MTEKKKLTTFSISSVSEISMSETSRPMDINRIVNGTVGFFVTALGIVALIGLGFILISLFQPFVDVVQRAFDFASSKVYPQ